MEAAASAIAVVQISAKVLHLTVKYYYEVKDARKEINWLESEVSDLQAILRRVVDVFDDYGDDRKAAEARLPAFSLLLVKDGPLDRCHAELTEVAAKLEKSAGAGDSKDKSRSSMRQFGIRALKWPFTSKEIKDSIAVLERCKASFNLALNADQTKLALDTDRLVVELGEKLSADHNDWQDQQKGQYRSTIIEWLSTVEPGVNWSNHDDARSKHQPGTGQWLIDHDAFKQWKQAAGSILWLYGKQGCGKSILSSWVIEHLREECEGKASMPLAYFYFDFGSPAKQSVNNCLRYLISRLTATIPEVPGELKDLYMKKCNYGNESPALSDLIPIFKLFAEFDGFEHLFIAIDALDECPANHRQTLFSFFETISSWTNSKIHLVATSRPESDITEAMASLPAITSIPIEGLPVMRDITHHIQTQLSSHPRLKKLPVKLKAEIESRLIADADEMFRWVDCQLDELKRCKNKALVTETLRTLPKTLEGTYDRILRNIQPDYQDFARRALWWLVDARRPLTTDEVAEAAILDPELETPFDPESRFFDPHDDILEILGSMVSVTRRDRGSDDIAQVPPSPATTIASTADHREELRLSHFSVKEYLISESLSQNSDPSIKSFHVTREIASSFMFRSSLQYIFHYAESSDRTAAEDDFEGFPLLRYACEYWFEHKTSSPSGSDKLVEESSYPLFVSSSILKAWLLVYTPDQPKKTLFEPPDEEGNSLHYACTIGLVAVAERLLQEGANVNSRTESGITPLHRVAERGHLDVVNLLLKYGADIHAATKGGRTPLQQSSRSGHTAVTEALLEAGADIETTDVDGWSPLYWAAESRRLDIVHLLLARGANPNFKTSSGGTALHQVCGRGYYEIAQCLVDSGADVNVATTWGRTPLHQAAAAGSLKVVELLLRHGADPNAMDKSEHSPMWLALENNHDQVVDVLRPLTKMVDPLASPSDSE